MVEEEEDEVEVLVGGCEEEADSLSRPCLRLMSWPEARASLASWTVVAEWRLFEGGEEEEGNRKEKEEPIFSPLKQKQNEKQNEKFFLLLIKMKDRRRSRYRSQPQSHHFIFYLLDFEGDEETIKKETKGPFLFFSFFLF